MLLSVSALTKEPSFEINTATNDFASSTDTPQSAAVDYSLSRSTFIFSNLDSRAISSLKDVSSDSSYSVPVSSIASTHAFHLASVSVDFNVDLTVHSTFTLNTWFVSSCSASVLPIPLTESLRSPMRTLLLDTLQPSTGSTIGNSISPATNDATGQISPSTVSDNVSKSPGNYHSVAFFCLCSIKMRYFIIEINLIRCKC